MARERILLVEDDEDILELVRYNLSKEGYTVACATTGEQGLKQALADRFDLLVLDLMLPGMDGLEVCRTLKSNNETRHMPILMLTARTEEADVVTGLELGADDYVTKPFSPRVLLARVRAVLRRQTQATSDESDAVHLRDMVIHPGRHEVLVDGEPVELTSTEFRVLHFLALRPGWVFTRAQIVEATHGDNFAVTERSVDVQVVGLRKKLGDAGEYIETVRGVGYRFKEQ